MMTESEATIFKVVLALLSFGVALVSSSLKEPMFPHQVLTSLNSSELILNIPKNYRKDVPIFSLELLSPEGFNHPRDYGKMYDRKMNSCRRRSKRSARHQYEDDKRNYNEEMYQERKKSRKKKDNKNKQRASGMFRSQTHDPIGGRSRNPNTKKRRKESKLKNKEFKEGGSSSSLFLNKEIRSSLREPPVFSPRDGYLYLCEDNNPNKDLFRLNISLESSTVSLYLSRILLPKDYMRLRKSSVNVTICERVFNDSFCTFLNQPLLKVVLHVTEPFPCDTLTENMCLVPTNFLKLQQWENKPVSPLLTLPSISSFCPGIRRTIKIQMFNKVQVPEVEFSEEKNAIVTTIPLDREFRNGDLKFNITCELNRTSVEGVIETSKVHNQFGILYILDVNDSPPITLTPTKVIWDVTEIHDDLDDKLMIIDPDIVNNQNYTVKILGDPYEMIHYKNRSNFTVDKKNCREYTMNKSKVLSADCTVFTHTLMFNKNKLKDYPSIVNFSMVIIDNNLVTDENNKIVYDFTLITDTGTGNGMSSVPHYYPTKTRYEKDFPLETNITITEPIQLFARLVQMLHIYSKIEFERMMERKRFFELNSRSSNYGIQVTEELGIVYVSDEEQLLQALKISSKLEIIVQRLPNFTASIFLELSDETVICDQKPPKPSYITVGEPTSCAIHAYKNNCENACGAGSLQGKCTWRSLKASSFKTENFATCSPDLDTCPDGFCDELEIKHKEICPQDCVEEGNTKGQHIELNKQYFPPRGISKGFGVCTCNDYCQCFPADSKMPTSDTPKKPKHGIGTTTGPGNTCGAACQIGVSIGTLSVIFLIFMAFCRRKKDCSGKYKDGDLGRQFSDYHEDYSSSGPVHSEAHSSRIHGINSMHFNSPRQTHFSNNNNDQDLITDLPSINFSIDSKWEFPRHQLVLEQTLGEGEFGKVIKGKALKLGGQTGYTTVAVKMLKDNSTASELADLLSEYDLLKEVNHPNVIRLLGACTAKKGPVYLLIEYCKYGSLRSYLSRSRHYEEECRVGSAPEEENPGDYTLTPKHLLSFAWQVCKGMDYVGSMKLVHRDLAARNVLLAEGKVCKISDFGLTRDVYESDIYFKRSKGRVPVKWMAIESLIDHVYTSKSDIWGFGVLLWELITLGSSPYPGVTPERIFNLLRSGYRMERPVNCSEELYQVMKSCWHEIPDKRPTFKQLVPVFERMIETDVEYLELKSLIVTNRSYFDDSLCDNIPMIPKLEVKHISPLSQDTELEHSFNQPEIDTTKLDKDCYLLATNSLLVIPPPSRNGSAEPLISTDISPNVQKAFSPSSHIHAHNPAYSPSREDFPKDLQPTVPPPLQYSSLASRPDEEEEADLTNEELHDNCRSEADSDSGRVTGDSGYITEDGKKIMNGKINTSSHPHNTFTNSALNSNNKKSSYSPLSRQEFEDDQDTSEDLEEKQELLTEDIFASLKTKSSCPNNYQNNDKKKKGNTSNVSNSLSSAGLSSADGLVFSTNQLKNRRSPVQV